MKLIFERLRDRMEVRFSPLFFILISLCENVLHEKLSRTPFSEMEHDCTPSGSVKAPSIIVFKKIEVKEGFLLTECLHWAY